MNMAKPVLTKYQCERCGGVLYSFDYGEGQGYMDACTRCGYSENVHPLNWTKGGSSYSRLQHFGRGGFKLDWGSDTTWGPLHENFRPDKWPSRLARLKQRSNPEHSYVAYYDPSSSSVTVLWGDSEPELAVGLPLRSHSVSEGVVNLEREPTGQSNWTWVQSDEERWEEQKELMEESLNSHPRLLKGR